MALQLGAVRDALMEAGARAESAAKAAEELASFERGLADMRGDLRVLKWMAGANDGLTLVILGSVFALWAKLGEVAGQIGQIARAAIH